MSTYIQTIIRSLEELIEKNPLNYNETKLEEIRKAILLFKEIQSEDKQEALKDLEQTLQSPTKQSTIKQLNDKMSALEKEIEELKNESSGKKGKLEKTLKTFTAFSVLFEIIETIYENW